MADTEDIILKIDEKFLDDIKKLKHLSSFGASDELIEFALKTNKSKIIPSYQNK